MLEVKTVLYIDIWDEIIKYAACAKPNRLRITTASRIIFFIFQLDYRTFHFICTTSSGEPGITRNYASQRLIVVTVAITPIIISLAVSYDALGI